MRRMTASAPKNLARAPLWARRRVLLVAVLLGVVFLVSLQLAPSVSEQRRDSGIFAYTAEVIREGGLPYLDAWDNKLPGVYFIDALAFAVFGTNRWALWLAENLTLFAAAWALFWLLKQLYGQRAETWAGTLIFVLLARHPLLVEDTNFTELYALLPQVVVLVAGYQLLRRPNARWGLLFGFAAGVAFLIKQTTVGVALAFVPAVWLSGHPLLRGRRGWRWAGWIAAGGALVLTAAVGYLLANGILDDAFDASFVMARSFHRWVGQESVWLGRTLITTLTKSAFVLVFYPLLPFLLIGLREGWGCGRVEKTADARSAAEAALARWAVLTFAVDLTLVNVTNRGYGHYYVTLLPAVTLLLTMSLARLNAWAKRSTWAQRGRVYLALVVVGVPLVASVARFWQANWQIAGPARQRDLAAYVLQHTNPEDLVLVWGAATVINFQSGRKSPTQYHYGYPLIVPDYSDEAILEFVRDLEANQPVMIVDTTMRDGYRVPPLDPVRRQQWWAEGGRRDTADLTPIYRFVAEHCRIVDEVDEAAIYRCTYD